MGGCRYAGIDWASEEHEVLVADEDGDRALAPTFAHAEEGRGALCQSLVRMKVVLVAVERPDGLLAEQLLDAGLRVLALHQHKADDAQRGRRVGHLGF
jgi:hypothetical protein